MIFSLPTMSVDGGIALPRHRRHAGSGTDKDVKVVRALFLKLKLGERRAAMDMLAD